MGNLTVNSVQPFCSDSTEMDPWCKLTIRSTRESPMPYPFEAAVFSALKNGWNI